MAAFFLSNYAQVAIHPFVFFKPKWWYIALGAGTAITGASIYSLYKPSWGEAAFVVSAVALALACVLVLGVSVYVLARIWIDTLKERKKRKKVKQ